MQLGCSALIIWSSSEINYQLSRISIHCCCRFIHTICVNDTRQDMTLYLYTRMMHANEFSYIEILKKKPYISSDSLINRVFYEFEIDLFITINELNSIKPYQALDSNKTFVTSRDRIHFI